ncbi:MAG: hypothetical protein CK541_00895 [Opitutia bacterium]|nr:DUF1990 family protein [Opitutales bacterium]PHX80290.1 MAG: hypothetical protein CK541_00895 [Opitutae bacterium]
MTGFLCRQTYGIEFLTAVDCFSLIAAFCFWPAFDDAVAPAPDLLTPVEGGDRLGLGLLVPNLPGLAPLMLPAIVEVDAVEAGAEHVAWGYVTTRRHYGRGVWRAEVKRAGEELVLTVSYHVRPSRWFVWCGLPINRRFQLAAFRAGADNLRRLAA